MLQYRQMIPVNSSSETIVFSDVVGGYPFTFQSTWGLFSPKQIDEGTRLLIDNLTVRLGDNNLDFGCGYGAIGLTMAKKAAQGHTHLVDKDFVAIDFAKRNAVANELVNAEIYLSNLFSAVPRNNFDNIASNIPARMGKEQLIAFITGSKDYLKPGGKLTVVCILGLKDFFKKQLFQTFGNCAKLAQGKTYTVFRATRQ